ncbi:hypothetical protein M8C21_023317 [Ambrosia artemisiifolia]|uniref:Aconitase/3-isopropylmalate dehydratase large subunit alpha/beta/alpha domain-containing protein n=1 Tax=Ambrosia artemisiifolia TaxID=4212 RepID=A0AAD5DBZ8_AMBAR|nr:hypothetical protein M8C21_023317 [Ambrosia artemisiifolia]
MVVCLLHSLMILNSHSNVYSMEYQFHVPCDPSSIEVGRFLFTLHQYNNNNPMIFHIFQSPLSISPITYTKTHQIDLQLSKSMIIRLFDEIKITNFGWGTGEIMDQRRCLRMALDTVSAQFWIAQDVARGLAYLREGMEFQRLYRPPRIKNHVTVGAEHIAPDSSVNPGNPAMRVRLMLAFCGSVTAANSFPSTLQCIFGCIYVGFKQSGKLENDVTTTDLVLTMTHMLRKHGGVGKFLEFSGNIFAVSQ